MITNMISLIILVFSLMLKVSAEDTTVFCEQPVTVELPISFCGGVVYGQVFPNSLGFAYLSNEASLLTSYWAESSVSVHVTTQTLSTLAHQAVGYNGICKAAVNYCESTKKLFTAEVTYFTVFMPSGVTGDVSFGTVTHTITTIKTTTEDVTATVTDTVTEVITVDVDNETCPEADTVIESVSYSIGTEGQLTIYTSGPTPGTSTVTLCAKS